MSGDSWLTQRERGTVWLIRLTIRMATLLGRRVMRLFVILIAFWYRTFDRKAVRASKQWLERVHGRRPGYWDVYRHIRTFAQVTLDRIFLVTGNTRGLTFNRTGAQYMYDQIASGQGAVLLGAHFGSFEAMRAGGDEEDIRIQVLGYFKNAKMINELLTQMNPSRAASVIHLGDDPIGVMAKVQARVAEGDFVALLGDRTGLNDRKAKVRFFGEEAEFPCGPFLLASLLRCPVYLVFGIYHEPGRYELSCEPFAERLDLPRKTRDAALQEVVQRYADRLEHHCRTAPDNWFNFYDFWRSSEPTETA